MIPALASATAGLRTGTARLDRAASDVANASTVGYRAAGARSRPGALVETGNPLDLAIAGDGWFRLASHDGTSFGEVLYTRAGDFHRDARGFVVARDDRYLVGYALDAHGAPTGAETRIQLPPDAVAVAVGADGIVRAHDSSGGTGAIAAVSVARFANADGLEAAGGGSFRATAASGAELAGAPGSHGLGLLAPAALERSNVDLADALVQTVLARHEVAASARSLTAADALLGSLVDRRA
jgi:flagellar hook protein FlgE